jgi:hypothetical protein
MTESLLSYGVVAVVELNADTDGWLATAVEAITQYRELFDGLNVHLKSNGEKWLRNTADGLAEMVLNEDRLLILLRPARRRKHLAETFCGARPPFWPGWRAVSLAHGRASMSLQGSLPRRLLTL